MAIWVVLAIMTGGAVLAVLWPLTRRARSPAAVPDEASFYKSQIVEIDRDCERGLIAPAEAEGAKVEAGRRLLRAAGQQTKAGDLECEPALRRRRAASAVALSTVPLIALSLYGALGSPNLPSQPLSARLNTETAKLDFAEAVARVENYLAQNPGDGHGWELIAPVYMRAGRIDDAVKAYEAVLRLNGDKPQTLADYGEASVVASRGVVEAGARDAFERALKLDATSPKARFYLAMAAEQDGDRAGALARLEDLLASSPADAPWRQSVEAQILRLGGAPSTVADLPEDQKAAINGMVEGLAARLKADGSDADGWLRLVRSYVVLGKRGEAQDALKAARASLKGRPQDTDKLVALARELRLEEAEAIR